MGNPVLPSVDSDTKQFTTAVRARIAANIADPATVEGTAIGTGVQNAISGGTLSTALANSAADPDSSFGVVNAATISSGATTLLVSKVVDSIPSNGSNISTFANVSGLTFSFVAPLSGKVIVRISAGYTLPSGTSSLELNLRDQSTGANIARTTRRMRRITGSAAAGEQNQYTYTTSLTSLVAGKTYNMVQGFRSGDAGGGSVAVQADVNDIWGPAIIEVLAVPADPVDPVALYNRFDANHLSKWVAGKAAVSGGTADAKVLVIGDSTAFGYPKGSLQQSWSHKLAQRFVTRGLSAQDGGTTPGLTAGDNPRYTAGTGWPSGILYGFGSQGWQYNNPSGSLKYADPYINADRFDVYFVRGSGATSITLQVDNETPVSFDGTGTTSIGKITASTSTAATNHTLTITAAGSGGILFVEPWLSTSKRIRVANAGAPSTNTTTWANGVGIYSQAMIAAYQPTVVICLLGANDAVSGATAKTVTTNLGILADAAVSAGADFINLSSVPCQILSEAALQQQYALRTRYGTSPAFMDLNREAGTWANWNSLGYMSDLRHPNEAGMERIATLVDAGLALV